MGLAERICVGVGLGFGIARVGDWRLGREEEVEEYTRRGEERRDACDVRRRKTTKLIGEVSFYFFYFNYFIIIFLFILLLIVYVFFVFILGVRGIGQVGPTGRFCLAVVLFHFTNLFFVLNITN